MPKSMVDYATDNITIYRSCPYQCKYCWAWRIPIFSNRIRRGKYDPVQEAERYTRSRNRKTIVISFTSDPYPPQEKELGLTRRVLEVLSETNHKVMILTKNPTLALRDLDLIRKGDIWLGTTLISINKTESEPYAPKPEERMMALEIAYEEGAKTWVSIEPIIPKVTYPTKIIQETKDYVDYYVLGSFNYVKQLGVSVSEKDKVEWYMQQVIEAIRLLETIGKKYYIKKELRRYIKNKEIN